MLIFDGFSKLWPLINNAAYQRVLSDVTYEHVFIYLQHYSANDPHLMNGTSKNNLKDHSATLLQ